MTNFLLQLDILFSRSNTFPGDKQGAKRFPFIFPEDLCTKKQNGSFHTLLTLIAPAALKSQSPEGQNPHGISIESLCSKPNQQQIEMLTRFAEERGVVFSRNNCTSLVENILKKGVFDPYKQKFLGLQPDVQAPPLMLAKTWKKGNNIRGWWMSEKFEGVRAFWTAVS